MFSKRIYNVNIASEKLMPTPLEVKEQLPLPVEAEERIFSYRETIENILDGKDSRLLLVVGPCSIHDMKAAKEYAGKLAELSPKVAETMFLVMRVYFEKPRTSVGWKGFLNDPHLDGSFELGEGIKLARELLLYLADRGVPAGTEALDPIIPQYIHDLISWTCIGARTTESQKHRELCSGLSTPVGFKNGTDGNIEVAVNALKAVAHPHHFIGINRYGQLTDVATKGNAFGHVVLRGGAEPNYDAASVTSCAEELDAAGLRKSVIIDCSHGNSHKKPELQPEAFNSCIEQVVTGDSPIAGLMLESHLQEGQQSVPDDLSQLKYGVSITDGCIGWEQTEQLILSAHERLKNK